MKTKCNHLLAFAASIAFMANVTARENVGQSGQHRPAPPPTTLASACNPATSQQDLNFNNVRARILGGGDMWWDLLQNPKYEVPKGGGVDALFAGALWIGGIDAGGQLKIAAMTYRQNGNDFWPGPLDTITASTNQTVCSQYDKHWLITRQEVQDYYSFLHGTPPPGYTGPSQAILTWPGNGDQSQGQGKYLAPFVDVVGDGHYDPSVGDYPAYNLTGKATTCQGQLYGDQTIWWVYNDKGNIHTETGGQAIGLEIRAQAFAFATNDEINNCTFYQYQVINRSSYQVNNVYFGQWVDPDLGCGTDDYVGCDVGRGFGYCYNGEAIDQNCPAGELPYGQYPPAIGVDFFQGPKAVGPGAGVDSYGTSFVDSHGNIPMTKFMYYNNDFTIVGNPQNATDYYNYLQGVWRDGTPMQWGGNGHNTGGVKCDFMFPGDPFNNSTTDIAYKGTGGVNPGSIWDEAAIPNPFGDRRFIQSAGPFRLDPGAVNYVTDGAVWARATNGNNITPIPLLQAADDKAQALFDNCFKVLDGPDAPDLTIQELQNELILTLSNKQTSNNYLEKYAQTSATIAKTFKDTQYVFEGYEIFQLQNASVTASNLLDPNQARLVAQCDVHDSIIQMVNFTFDQTLNANVPTLEVTGANNGITHSFNITKDLFNTSGNPTLVDNKQYYYMVISYAWNNYETYDQGNPATIGGQKVPFLQGRNNIQVYTGIPHIPEPQNGGTVQAASYANGPSLTRVEGQGNGGNILDLTPQTVTNILNSPTNSVTTPTYVNGGGPVLVKVIDPLNVPNNNFVLKFYQGVNYNSHWTLTDLTTGVIVKSDTTIHSNNEQIIPQWGLSVVAQQVSVPGTQAPTTFNTVGQTLPLTTSAILPSSGVLQATMTFADPTKNWLTGVPYQGGGQPQTWIMSGTVSLPAPPASAPAYNSYKIGAKWADPNGDFTKIIGGTWAPYFMCLHTDASNTSLGGPQCNSSVPQLSKLSDLASIDVVITADKSKWSRCPVFEMEEASSLAIGNASKLDIRKSPSVDKNGVANYPSTDNSDFAMGMGWFPGYAINVETGERLNICFGEDSWLTSENGADMKWDPTADLYSNPVNFNNPALSELWGGKHYIYVFGHNGDSPTSVSKYDAGFKMRTLLDDASGPTNAVNKRSVFADAMWVNIPLLNAGHQLLETDVKIRIRVGRPYMRAYAARYGASNAAPSIDSASPAQNTNYPMYTFNTADLQTKTSNLNAAQNALALINIVPNPYYAYSAYETNAVDNRVKITCLPQNCTITIFTLNGTLIRLYKKNSPVTYLDWDLKNQAEVPIASGMYIIHVDVPGVGEKTLKWFGVMRPIDLNSF
ncbi:MAG: T9SS C-terminal target domain-containing protein [Bacteroidia bacterium]